MANLEPGFYWVRFGGNPPEVQRVVRQGSRAMHSISVSRAECAASNWDRNTCFPEQGSQRWRRIGNFDWET
jgi:hypothetical protein